MDSSGLAETLVASELFGHEKGEFARTLGISERTLYRNQRELGPG